MSSLSDYDIDTDATVLRDLVKRILETVVSVFESYNVPIPTRRYYTIGAPVADCEQVVVSFVQVFLGKPGDPAAIPQPCNGPRSAVVTVSIMRNVSIPATGISNPATLEKEADFGLADAWILFESLNQFDRWGDAARGLGVIATINAVQPTGGMHVTSMQLTVGID
jgi:hypothetical protein